MLDLPDRVALTVFSSPEPRGYIHVYTKYNKFIGIYLRSQVSVYRTIGPLVHIWVLVFGLVEYRSPQRTNTPLSYIVQYMAAHIHAKAFVGSQGGKILYRTFS